jgi:hypothetical protein
MEPRKPLVVNVVIVVALLGVLYPLSSGPAYWWLPIDHAALRIVYSPLFWLEDNVLPGDPIYRYIGWRAVPM